MFLNHLVPVVKNCGTGHHPKLNNFSKTNSKYENLLLDYNIVQQSKNQKLFLLG